MLLQAIDISKSYGAIDAVNSVNFEVGKGEVHGLVGANGAGKSTLTKLLSGAEKIDSGKILLNDLEIKLGNPREALDRGIAVIHQESPLIPNMNAVENIFLGSSKSMLGVLSKKSMKENFFSLSEELEIYVPHDRPVKDLPVSTRQMVDILRATQAKRQLFFMDEPTAALGPNDREKLYLLIKKLRSQGATIVFISHDLNEVLSICTSISIMRNGRLVKSGSIENFTKASIVAEMVGKENIDLEFKKDGHSNEILFRAEKIHSPGKFDHISFEVHKGEIFGIAGLIGSGRTEILRAISGADNNASGTLIIDKKQVALPISVRAGHSNGIVMVPEDRKSEGLIFERSVEANLAVANLDEFASFGVLIRKKMRAAFEKVIMRVKLSSNRLLSKVGTLSGGNQQKVVMAKCLLKSPKLLLLDEPSRGVDVIARKEIYESILAASKEGMSIILVSSDINEVIEYSDRILVLAAGRNLGILSRGDADLEKILSMKFDA